MGELYTENHYDQFMSGWTSPANHSSLVTRIAPPCWSWIRK